MAAALIRPSDARGGGGVIAGGGGGCAMRIVCGAPAGPARGAEPAAALGACACSDGARTAAGLAAGRSDSIDWSAALTSGSSGASSAACA